jgi:hypothetical protein
VLRYVVQSEFPGNGPATLVDLVPLVYDDVPVRMHRVASRSLLAHLIKLRDEGRAAEAGGRWVVPGS